ncbi:hypothetical protein [Rhizobacter sp. P5_C2]
MNGDIVTLEELNSLTGDCRLALRYVKHGEDGLDFHSLALEARTPTGWVPTAVITEEQFQGSYPNRRWVSSLHSFLPSAGTAIIQVAEGDRPMHPARATLFHYSWRRWDVVQNVELARLKDCAGPFDPL